MFGNRIFARDSKSRWLWLTFGVIAVPIVYGIVSLCIGLAIVSDSGWGFLVLKSMQSGGPFNVLIAPDAANIATDTQMFLSSWTPGQYLLPAAIHAFGVTLGSATSIIVTISSVLGLLGCLTLYRSFGFPQKTVLISCLFLALTSWFASPFTTYNGGEVLLFATAPWLMWIVWRLRTLPASSILVLVLAFLTVTMVKLTGAMLAFALLCGAVAGALGRSHRELFQRIGVATLAGLGFSVLFYFMWLRHGGTPGTSGGQLNAYGVRAIAFPIKTLLTSPLGIGDELTYWLNSTTGLLFQFLKVANACIGIASLLIGWYVWKALPKEFAEYRNFAFGAVAAYIAAFAALYTYGTVVSLEDRHFRLIACLGVVGVVHVFSTRSGLMLRSAATLVALFTIAFGVTSFGANASRNLSLPLGSQGFRHSIASEELLAFIRDHIERSDTPRQSHVVLVPTTDIGLEITNARVIPTNVAFDDIEEVRARSYSGKVRRVDALLQKTLPPERVDLVLRSFKDYDFDGWKKIDLGKFLCFTQELPENPQSASLSGELAARP